MKPTIGYLRVSTSEQGRSGLGLAAQRFDIERFCEREEFKVVTWHQDIQTGAGRDALLVRPGLAAALKEARALRCALIVSRLDRLSRNVHLIAELMEHKVHFLVALFGKDVDHFTLHIYASIAEQERKMIGERIKAAIAVAKRRGRKYGLLFKRKSWQRHVSALGRAVRTQEANDRAKAYRVYVEWAMKQPGRNGRRISFTHAAAKLNARNIETPFGGRWMGHHLQRMARRLGIEHPLAMATVAQAKARVQVVFAKNPHCTVEQAIAALDRGGPNLLWRDRVFALLKDCRRAAAMRSPLYRRMRWPIDHKTTTRIQIAALYKRNPAITGPKVIDTFGTEYSWLRLKWVEQILRDCAHAFPHSGRRLEKSTAIHNPFLLTQSPRQAALAFVPKDGSRTRRAALS